MTSINNEEIPLIGDIVPNKAAKIVKDNNEKYLLKEERNLPHQSQTSKEYRKQ